MAGAPDMPGAGEATGPGAAALGACFGAGGLGPGALFAGGTFAVGAGARASLPFSVRAGAIGPGLGTGPVFEAGVLAACGAGTWFLLPGFVAWAAFSGLGLAATGVPGFGGFATKPAGLPKVAGLGFVFVCTAGVRGVPFVEFADAGAVFTAEAGLVVPAGGGVFPAAGAFAAAAALAGVGRTASVGTAFFAGTPFFDAGCFGMLALPRMDSTMLDICQADNLPFKSMTTARLYCKISGQLAFHRISRGPAQGTGDRPRLHRPAPRGMPYACPIVSYRPQAPHPGRLCAIKTNDPRPCNRTADHFFVAGTGFEPVTSGL